MPVWGQSLVSVALNDQRAVPLFLEKCFKYIIDKYLDTEGIFRIAGPQSEIKSLIETIDAIGDIKLNENTSVFSICNIITRFIKDIPGHILNDKNANQLQQCTNSSQIRTIFQSLPIINRAVFSRLIGFMTLVCKHSSTNLMTVSNIAIILSPILVDDPSNPQFILSKEVCEMILNDYTTICADMLALDSNGNWLSDEEFSKSIGSVITAFLCHSSYMTKQLTPIKVEKPARMIRNMRIDVGGWDSMLNELLAINPSNQQTCVIPLTKL